MVIGRFNSVEPTNERGPEPMIEPTHTNVKRTTNDVVLVIGRFNSAAPSKPLTVPRLKQ